MVIFSVTRNSVSLTVNITSSWSSGDPESDMSDVRECQTKSEVKMENSYKVDPGPQGLLPRYGFLSMFL